MGVWFHKGSNNKLSLNELALLDKSDDQISLSEFKNHDHNNNSIYQKDSDSNNQYW